MEQLTNLVAQDDTVIFVGSGVSRWAGLPDWPGLVEQLANYLISKGQDASLVRHEAADGDLLQAASYGFARLTKPQIAEFVRMATRTGAVGPTPLHEAIMNLGPSCFVTTNYDDLIEQAYRRWRPAPAEPRVVTNRQLVEQADIVHAQARGFIFKPHGDARDSESIVLTREQYRMLLPDGPLSATLVTLKTLLPSRPMLFVGFGLRDPDFMYVRDLLANIYRGGMRDHYAIVADPVDGQIDYWRDNYGVHLIGYLTKLRADGTRDHSSLIDLLRDLGNQRVASVSPRSMIDRSDPTMVLGLARYAAGNLAAVPPDRFSIYVAASSPNFQGTFSRSDQYNYWAAERFLLEGPERVVLTGAPGAGKSFAIRNAVTELATRLQDACLQGHLTNDTIVPIVLDLKLYDGNLREQLQARFPPQLDLRLLQASFPVKLYLDGFNEMPRAHLETGVFNRQVEELLEEFPRLGLLIGSRTSDGLERLELPAYELSQIPASEVKQRLNLDHTAIDPAHRDDVVSILQRPFYFGLVERAMISVRNIQSPNDLYAQYIGYICAKFLDEFPAGFHLVKALEHQAYRTLEQGLEAFALAELADSLRGTVSNPDDESVQAVLNWLVSVNLLIPLTGARGAFVHQSVTEYLAARRLSQLLKPAENDVSDLIVLRRWDNAIFLTLSLLDRDAADKVLQQLVDLDLAFAINGARFVESGREQFIERLLEILSETGETALEHDVVSGFARLPFAPLHEPLLRKIVNSDTSLAGPAMAALVNILGNDYKEELIGLLFKRGHEWSLLQGMSALSTLLHRNDIPVLIDQALTWHVSTLDEDMGETHQRVSALARALGGFSAEVIRSEVFSILDECSADQKQIITALICDLYTDRKSRDGLEMVMALVEQRLPKSTFAILLNVRYDKELQSHFARHLNDALLLSIISYIEKGDRWAVELLQAVCANHPAIAERVVTKSRESSNQIRQILEYCGTGNEGPLFAWMENLANDPEHGLSTAVLQSVDWADLNWHGRNNLFVKLLTWRDPKLASLILGASIPVHVEGLDEVDMGPVRPWFEWLLELIERQEGEEEREMWWLSQQLAFLIARSADRETKSQILYYLDHGEPGLRWAIANMVLPYMEGLLMEDLSDESISFLLDLLRVQPLSDSFRPSVLAAIASEAFINERLLPLVAQGDELLRQNVELVVRHAGKRLGRRFVLPART